MGHPIKWIRFLSILGILDTGFLVYSSLLGEPVPCGEGGGCNEVLSSEHAFIFGFPLSAVGLGAFLALLVLSAFYKDTVGFKNRAPAVTGLLILSSSLSVPAVFSLIYVQAFVINSFCYYCLFSSLLFLLVFVLALKMKAGRKQGFAKMVGENLGHPLISLSSLAAFLIPPYLYVYVEQVFIYAAYDFPPM